MSFYRVLLDAAPLPVRVFAYQYVARGGKSLLDVDRGDDRFGVIGTKMWGDGSVLLGNVAVTRPYLNTEMTLTRMGLPKDSTGKLNYPKDDLHWLIDAYAQQGHQIAVHAQGDHTIDVVLDGYETALKKWPNAKRPFRIEHCGLMRDDQLERAKSLGVVCSFFLPMFHYWGDCDEPAPARAGARRPLRAERQRRTAGYARVVPLRRADDVARFAVDAVHRDHAAHAQRCGTRCGSDRRHRHRAALDHDRRRIPHPRGRSHRQPDAGQVRRFRAARSRSSTDATAMRFATSKFSARTSRAAAYGAARSAPLRCR